MVQSCVRVPNLSLQGEILQHKVGNAYAAIFFLKFKRNKGEETEKGKPERRTNKYTYMVLYCIMGWKRGPRAEKFQDNCLKQIIQILSCTWKQGKILKWHSIHLINVYEKQTQKDCTLLPPKFQLSFPLESQNVEKHCKLDHGNSQEGNRVPFLGQR